MSMAKVSKYSNDNNYNHVHIHLLESINSIPNILQDDCYGKLPLISKSVVMTRIDIHHAGEEHDQHVIRLTLRGSHVCQPFAKSLLCRNRSPVHGWSLGSRPHSPFHHILKAEGAVPWSSYMSTRLIGPYKTRYVVSTQLKAYHQGQNDVVLNRHRRGLPHRNLRIATTLSPSFPFECSTDPPTCPSRSSNNK
jgi:hypothetical protein